MKPLQSDIPAPLPTIISTQVTIVVPPDSSCCTLFPFILYESFAFFSSSSKADSILSSAWTDSHSFFKTFVLRGSSVCLEIKHTTSHDSYFTHLASTLNDVKMHISVFISTILGAGALAFPNNKHAHLHEKKDIVFYSQWQEGPHTLVQEFINENKVVGNAPPPAATSGAVGVKADYAAPPGGHHSWAGQAGKLHERPPASATSAPTVPEAPSTVITSQAVSSTPPAPALLQASPVDNTPPTSPSSSTPESSGSDTTTSTTSTTSGACNPTDGDAWYSPPCTGSSGASALDKMSNLRKKWNPTLTDYTWNASLAQNSHDTAWLATTWTQGTDSNGKTTETPDGEGRGWVMGHHRFNGTNAQCIAEGDNTQSKGDLTPIEIMFLEWICEKPSSTIQDMCTAAGRTGGDPNCYCADINKGCTCGHAMIIEDTGLNSIGCYFMNKVATGKTDNAVNAIELSQELGTPNNMAPGMLTCDFSG